MKLHKALRLPLLLFGNLFKALGLKVSTLHHFTYCVVYVFATCSQHARRKMHEHFHSTDSPRRLDVLCEPVSTHGGSSDQGFNHLVKQPMIQILGKHL